MKSGGDTMADSDNSNSGDSALVLIVVMTVGYDHEDHTGFHSPRDAMIRSHCWAAGGISPALHLFLLHGLSPHPFSYPSHVPSTL